MTEPMYFDIYSEHDLNVFKALADLVVKERVTGRKPTVDEVQACGTPEHQYPANTILAIVMLLAKGEEGKAYSLAPLPAEGVEN